MWYGWISGENQNLGAFPIPLQFGKSLGSSPVHNHNRRIEFERE